MSPTMDFHICVRDKARGALYTPFYSLSRVPGGLESYMTSVFRTTYIGTKAFNRGDYLSLEI